jgi:hypothetical protein
MLREYEADKNPQKTVNLLKAVQWIRAAWELSVTRDTIKRYWVKSTLIEKLDSTEESAEDSTEDYIIVDNRTDRAELQDQITQLLIENPLSLDEFLNPEDEVIVDEDDDIFTTVVEHYSIDKPGKEDELSDEEEVEQIDETIALRAIETIRLWKLQRGTDQDIKVLDRIEREVVQYKSSIAHQTTILRFFKPN